MTKFAWIESRPIKKRNLLKDYLLYHSNSWEGRQVNENRLVSKTSFRTDLSIVEIWSI